MKGRYLLPLFGGWLLAAPAVGQEADLLSLIEAPPAVERVRNAFKGTRVINGHSMEMLAGGVLDFRILHRFGRLNEGSYELFGLDQASIRLGLDYGVTDWLTVGVGRSTHRKEIDGLIKARILSQTEGGRTFPFSLVAVEGMTVNTLRFADPERTNYFSSRLNYYHQLIIGRKFSQGFSLQLSPTLVHRNLVDSFSTRHDVVAAGLGARLKLTKRIALMVDYFAVVDNWIHDTDYEHPLSVGFDIETGGHVFQLHFTNAVGMNERAFITETTGSWDKGDIHFGFNISRVFTLHNKNRPKP
jgi:hypothetical protein